METGRWGRRIAARSAPPEGGWLHIEKQALVDDALQAKAKGFKGAKVKIGLSRMVPRIWTGYQQFATRLVPVSRS